MSWDSSAFHLQSVARGMLSEDPDFCIEALAGLTRAELSRLRLLIDLAAEFREQPSASGLVDSGLSGFSEPEEQEPLGGVADASITGGPKQVPAKQPPARPAGSAGSSGPSPPAGAPPARYPTVPTPTWTPGQPPAAGDGSDPWAGWHAGLLGHTGPVQVTQTTTAATGASEPSGTDRQWMSTEAKRRADLAARGLQPGTIGDTPPGSGDRRHPRPTLRMADLSSLEAPALEWVDCFQGLPYVKFEKVGSTAPLPNLWGFQHVKQLRPNRETHLARSLRRHGHSLTGYCLVECTEVCDYSCSRPVSITARRNHTEHVCQHCHRD